MPLLLLAGVAVVAAAPGAAVSAAIRVAVGGTERAWIVAFPSRATEPVTTYRAAGTAVEIESTGTEPVLVCAGADGLATQCEQLVPGRQQLHRFELSAGRRVEGRCFAGRAPAEGASVSIRPADVELRRPLTMPLALEERQWRTSVRTDADGRFVVEHLAPGRYVFAITTAAGQTEESDVVTVPPLEPPREGQPPPSRTFRAEEFRLAEGIGVTVEVRGGDGLPVREAAVEVVQQNVEGRVRVIGGIADDDGMAQLDGIDPAVATRVSCAAKGFARATQVFDVLPPLVTCTLDRLGGIRGTAADRHGQPLAGAVIELAARDMRTTTGAGGTFVLEEVPAGSHELRISAAATGVSRRTVELRPGEVADVGTVVLEEAVPLRGRVLDAVTGNAIPGAAVSAVDPPHGGSAATAEDGKFMLPGDAVTPTRVRVTAAGYAPAYATLRAGPGGGDGENAAILLARPGTIEVQAWDDGSGEPCRGCTIIISHPEGTYVQITDGDGVARQHGLAPGQYDVLRERVAATSKLVTVSGGGDTRVATVRPGEMVRVELGSRARIIRIALSPPPPSGWQLTAQTGGRFVVPTPLETEGTYSFRRDASESYELRLHTPQAGVVLGTVPAASTQELFPVTLPGGVLQLHASGAKGPTPGLQFKVVDAGGSTAGWGVTNGEGSARIPYLRTGRYTVVAAGRSLGAVNVTEGSTAVLRAVMR